MFDILADSLFGAHIDSLANVVFWIVFAQVLMIVAMLVCTAFSLRQTKKQKSEEPQPREEEPAKTEQVQVSGLVAADAEEDSFEAGKLRYDRSFLARLIQSDDWIKERYNLLKNEILSFEGVKSRLSWKRETFKAGKNFVARLTFRGKTLCALFPIDPEHDSNAETIDAPTLHDTPSMYRIRNEKHFKMALAMVHVTAQNLNLKPSERVSEDYYLPYEGTVQLIGRGLIKREIKSAQDEAIFTRNGNSGN